MVCRSRKPRLSFKVARYRIHLEDKLLAPGTSDVRLAATRRLAYKAADSELLSPDLAAGIGRVKGAQTLRGFEGPTRSAVSWPIPSTHAPTMQCALVGDLRLLLLLRLLGPFQNGRRRDWRGAFGKWWRSQPVSLAYRPGWQRVLRDGPPRLRDITRAFRGNTS